MSPDLATIVTALSLYAAVVISPGPNFALISRLAVSGARLEALGATVGLAIGATVYAILTMTGLALLLTRIGGLASLVQVAGGCYLVYLGLSAWRSGGPATIIRRIPSDDTGVWRGVRKGLLVNLSNPKGIAFFIGLYAVAVPPDTALWAKLVILLVGFGLEIVWYGLVTVCLSTLPARRAYDRFGGWIDRGVGTILAAFGLRLIVEKL